MYSNNKEVYTDEIGELYNAVVSLKTPEDCRAFFEDICSVKELHSMAQRLEVAKMLSKGQSFNQITASTGASTATISRVSRCLSKGSGGYKKVI